MVLVDGRVGDPGGGRNLAGDVTRSVEVAMRFPIWKEAVGFGRGAELPMLRPWRPECVHGGV